MIGMLRDFRLIPIVLVAAGSLFALKTSGLIFDGGYTLGERLANRDKNELSVVPAESVPEYPKIIIADNAAEPAPAPKKSWAQEMFNFQNGDLPDAQDVTGSVGSTKAPEKKAEKKDEAKDGKDEKKSKEKKADNSPKDSGGVVIPTGPNATPAGERAILSRLHDRRQELDARSRELDMRENLLKAAEKRLEARVAELKDVENRVAGAVKSREKAESERFRDLITMYENMKAKDAARIFDRLDINILVAVSAQINPRKMSEILGQMSPEAAERLTVELANRAQRADKAKPPAQLPKIEGQPNPG